LSKVIKYTRFYTVDSLQFERQREQNIPSNYYFVKKISPCQRSCSN